MFARIVECNATTVKDVIQLKREGKTRIPQLNDGIFKPEVSTLPANTNQDNYGLSTPPSKVMQHNASKDEIPSDIQMTEQHIFKGDYHIILENPEDTEKTLKVEDVQVPPPFNKWIASQKDDSDIMKAFKEWSEPLFITCNLCLEDCSRGQAFQKHLEEVHRVCNMSKNLFEEKQHKCILCHESIRQHHFNLENHFKEKHNLALLDYYKKYIAELKQFDFPSEEEEDEDDSEFIEAMWSYDALSIKLYSKLINHEKKVESNMYADKVIIAPGRRVLGYCDGRYEWFSYKSECQWSIELF